MADLIRRTVGPEITVETVAMTGLWTALVAPSQLENALLNLAINARDAMPDGGRLTIETANRRMDDRAARERDLPSGQYLSLCVSDTGVGMPPDVAARVTFCRTSDCAWPCEGGRPPYPEDLDDVAAPE